ncbi:MAG TPA: methyltransferase domain-containing protein [Terriglobia bacterium]|nr:methyltransferase domain-containing protein [Terriglobia bacterium]
MLCTVRGCRQPLAAAERRWVCPAGHSFDVARQGYVNLLQPQDRRSRAPGDDAELLAARRRVFERGVELPFFEAITTMLPTGPLLDVGCGEALYFANFNGPLHGVDISTAAIEMAARRHPEARFIVANADRFLPYADQSFGALTSITGRHNPTEFRRVLHPEGRLIVVIPGPDDLVELRGQTRDRVERTIRMFAEAFRLERLERLSRRVTLDRQALRDLAVATYRPKRMPETDALEVTLSRDALLFSGL